MAERRRYPRVQSQNLVSVGDAEQSVVGVARTVVVSEGGALLEMAEPYPLHTVFRLELALEGELLPVEAEVRDVTPSDHGTYAVGVRFKNLAPEDRERLDRFVEEQRADDDE